MKVKVKDLGFFTWLANQTLPRTLGTSKIFKVKNFARSVRNNMEILNQTEEETAKQISDNWNPYEGFTGPDAKENLTKYDKKMKEVFEGEVDIEEFPKFKLDDWKSLEFNSFQFDLLTEYKIIVEE